MNIAVCVLAGLCGLLVVAVAVLVYLWQKAKAEPGETKSQLEQLQQAVKMERENFEARMLEKDRVCQNALKEKDAACQKLIDAKDKSCADAIAEKAATCERLIADKESACSRQLADKDEACARVIAEKDAVLRRKDEDVKQMLADRDEQQAKVLREKNVEIERFLQEKEKSFAEVVKTLQEQFANLAAQTLKTQSGDLTKKNSEQLEGVLKPLREQLEVLRSATEKTQTEHAKLAEAIDKDVGRISDVAKELAGVSEALSSNSGFQGRKGEEILAEKLRQAGLEEGVNFFLQTGISSDRPDAQVCDTENRWLIIDSKVVLTSYFQYVEAKDEKTRQAKLAEHVARVREKIDQLAKKKYPKVFSEEHKDRNYLPVTAMFVGYEAPLLEALKAEPSLWKFAADNNVILVTPLTLLAYLRLVYLAWQHEKEARNQEEVVNTARELLSRMNTFLTTFEGVGKAILDMQAKYDDARSVLVDAPHAQTIAKAAKNLIDLHVRLESRKGKRIERAACLKELGEAESVVAESKVVEISDASAIVGGK